MQSLLQYIIEAINESNNRIDLSKKLSALTFEEIKNKQQLQKVINDSEPDTNKKKGFWLFDEALKKDENAYGSIKKEPWYIQYYVVKYENNIVGMVSFSLERKAEKRKYNPCLYIIDIQTLPEYKGALKAYFSFLEKIAKENKKEYLILMAKEESLIPVYKSFGFVKYSKYRNMYKHIGDDGKKSFFTSIKNYIRKKD